MPGHNRRVDHQDIMSLKSSSPGGSKDATPEEVMEQINMLTEEDMAGFLMRARRLTWGSQFGDASDLLGEALASPLIAAHGKGGRRWPKHVLFGVYVIVTMKALAIDSLRAPDHWRRGRLEEAEEGVSASPQDLLEEAELESLKAEIVLVISEHFAKDAEVTWILEGVLTGMSAAEIQSQGGMSKRQYEAARKRLSRFLMQMRLDWNGEMEEGL